VATQMLTKYRVPAHFHDAVMQLPPEQRRDRRTMNEAIRGADPDAQR
jgi:hypothetical protein